MGLTSVVHVTQYSHHSGAIEALTPGWVGEIEYSRGVVIEEEGETESNGSSARQSLYSTHL